MGHGRIGWIDLTTEHAPRVRDFYRQVAGWEVEEVPMGEYADYLMKAGGEAVAGVCHARGNNADLPSSWMVYITVSDLDAALELCSEHGGCVRVPARSMGEGRMAVIEDPSGAVCALFEPA